MRRSRVTLATMDAAAMEAIMASPPITAWHSQRMSMRSRPSTKTSFGFSGNAATARAKAHNDARRILSRSMRHGGAHATETCALAQIFACSFSRVAGSSFLESSSPRGIRLGSRITAAATTGPASGPRPASSHPATGHTPRLSAERSRRNVGRTSSSANGKRGAVARAGVARLKIARLMAAMVPAVCAMSMDLGNRFALACERRGLHRMRRCRPGSSNARAISSEEGGISSRQAGAKRRACPPSHASQLAAVEKLARHAVRTRGIEEQLSTIFDHLGNQPGKLRNGDLLAAADIEVLLVRIALENKHTGIREVVHKQKLAQGLACPPYRDGRSAVLVRLMKTPDQRRHDMAVLRMIVVAWTIKISRHDGDKIAPVLTTISLAQFYPCNFRNRIPLVGGLERASEQFLLAHGLLSCLRINAGGAEKQQFLHARLVAAVDGIACDGQILRDELGRVGTIGVDAADLGRGDNHHVGSARAEEGLDLRLALEIDAFAGSRNYLARFSCQTAGNGGADHAAMAGNINARAGEAEYLLGHLARVYALLAKWRRAALLLR